VNVRKKYQKEKGDIHPDSARTRRHVAGRNMSRKEDGATKSRGHHKRWWSAQRGPQHACVSARTKVSIRVHIVNSQLSPDDTNIARGRAVAWGVMFETEKRERKKTGM